MVASDARRKTNAIRWDAHKMKLALVVSFGLRRVPCFITRKKHACRGRNWFSITQPELALELEAYHDRNISDIHHRAIVVDLHSVGRNRSFTAQRTHMRI